MQYIKKGNMPPGSWDDWFTTATSRRSYDYDTDHNSLTQLPLARAHLINEQYGLCAYCQSAITLENSSIEHVVPKELNKELSTCYFNLVAVCKTPFKDPVDGRLHCDKEKESKVISPLLFVSDAEATALVNHGYFHAYSDGSIIAKTSKIAGQQILAQAFIDVVNLNHSLLKTKRAKDSLDGLIAASIRIPKHQRHSFWKMKFKNITLNKSQPYRQFLLINIGTKLGMN